MFGFPSSPGTRTPSPSMLFSASQDPVRCWRLGLEGPWVLCSFRGSGAVLLSANTAVSAHTHSC